MGIGSYLPDGVYDNFYFQNFLDTSDDWIRSRTGIIQRRFVPEGVSTSDIAAIAAEEALSVSGVDAEDIDLIIVATATPDRFFPSTASKVQEKIKAKKAAAFDLSAGCSGFLYGLAVACELVKNNFFEKVLLIGAETLSKFIDMKDRSTCILFGDGAGAMVIGKGKSSFFSFVLGSDGRGGSYLELPAGGSLRPASRETIEEGLHFVKMDGKLVFK